MQHPCNNICSLHGLQVWTRRNEEFKILIFELCCAGQTCGRAARFAFANNPQGVTLSKYNKKEPLLQSTQLYVGWVPPPPAQSSRVQEWRPPTVLHCNSSRRVQAVSDAPRTSRADMESRCGGWLSLDSLDCTYMQAQLAAACSLPDAVCSILLFSILIHSNTGHAD